MARAVLVGLLAVVGSIVGGLVLFMVAMIVTFGGSEDLEPAAAASSPVPTATSEPTAVEPSPTTSDQAALREAEEARADKAKARAEAGKRIAAEKAAEKAAAEKVAEKEAAEKAAAEKKAAEKAAAKKAAAKEAAEKEVAEKVAAEKAAADRAAAEKEAAEKKAAAEVLKVVSIVDGDTVDVSNGARIRIAGIDTPERGECGYDEAGARMAELARDREAVLVRAGADSIDRYGRLIRYLDVNGRDVGLTLIQEGLAIARYDSRDGYGWHDREAEYVAADAASPQAYSCRPKPAPQPAPQPVAPQPPAGGGTDPRFGTCKEALASGYGPYVVGVHPEYDWYRDADGDGIVCER